MVRVKRTYGMGRGLSSSREEPDRGRRWGGKQGGKGRGDEECKSGRLRLRQGERAAATRRASAGRWPAGRQAAEGSGSCCRWRGRSGRCGRHRAERGREEEG